MATSEQVKEIAQAAIDSINQLTSLIAHGPSTTRFPSNERQPTTSETTFVRQTQPTNSALTELQRRFPTVSRGRYRRTSDSSSRPYPVVPNVRRPAGRPLASEIVSKDVMILEMGREKIPTKAEKLDLERSGRIISGVDIDRKRDAKKLQQELAKLLTGEMEGLYFEIVKNSGGNLLRPNIQAGKEIDSKLLLKSIAPSGWIYVRLLEELPSMIDPSDKQLEVPVLEVLESDMLSSDASGRDDLFCNIMDLTKDSDGSVPLSRHMSDTNADANKNAGSVFSTSKSQPPSSSFDIQSVIKGAKDQGLTDPVEVLKFLQKEIVTGRALEVTSCEETIEGETNYITVDRANILETTISELEYITNYRPTFQVDFMAEECVDQGGPRKEWIRLMNQAIKEKYLDHGLRTLLAQDYYFVGVMMAVAMLQNGQLPVFVEESTLQQIVSLGECFDPCVRQIRHGLEELGMLSALQELPILVHLLRPQARGKLSVQMLLHILKPHFSEEGSNTLKKEKEVYQLFVKYVREVAASRRVCGQTTLDLSHILQFATGTAEEPVLGFSLAPSLEFILPTEIVKVASQEGLNDEQKKGESDKQQQEQREEQHPPVEGGFLPLAHTCNNLLELPRPTEEVPLPPMDRLFALYDVAFSQCYFGKK